MATANRTDKWSLSALLRPRIDGLPAASARFDWLIALLSLWILSGLFLDGWAHNTFPQNIDTFLTPWHAVLYSGFFVTGLALAVTWGRNVLKGYAWQRALPAGYMPSLAGAAVFAFGGAFDFAWHQAFGFEANTEALLSPSHLVLATGGVLLLSGPLRALWGRRTGGERAPVPAILSLFAVMSSFTFFTMFSNGFQHANVLVAPPPEAPVYLRDATGISYVLIPSVLLMGFILFFTRRWTLPLGSLTFLIAGNAALMFLLGESYSGEHWPTLVAALAGGVVADVLYAWLRPSPQRIVELRVFAFAVPFLLFLFYFTSLILTATIYWRIHMWLGAPFLAGVVGLGLSLVAVPPTLPASEE